MPTVFASFARPAAALALLAAVQATPAMGSERAFLKGVQGQWSGSGNIVAGKYKNTRFTCKFKGVAPKSVGMDIAGTCRVGLFTQPMSARITKKGATFSGAFLDGAAGKGLDLSRGKLRGKKMVLGIKRKKLRGQMVANLRNPNQLHVTISVNAGKSLVPVIGLTLNRSGASKTALKD